MLIDHSNRSKWLKLLAAFKAASQPQYVPEYASEGERHLNYRYYR